MWRASLSPLGTTAGHTASYLQQVLLLAKHLVLQSTLTNAFGAMRVYLLCYVLYYNHRGFEHMQ